jgi:hypothetical protein
MKKIILLAIICPLIGIAQLKTIPKKLPVKPKVTLPKISLPKVGGTATTAPAIDIAAGLKEALNKIQQ